MLLLCLLLISEPTTVRTTVGSFNAFGASWNYAICRNADVGNQTLEVRRNSKLVWRSKNDYPLGDGRMTEFPVGYHVFAYRVHTGCGHGQETTFFHVTSSGFRKMGSVSDERGGPVFRDFDADGRLEWVFDDYDHYTYNGANLNWLDVYKVNKAHKLIHWKRIRNSSRLRLKDYVGLHF